MNRTLRQSSRPSNDRRCGFTLIELLVVLALIALLLTLAAPRYFGSLDRSRDAALQENLRVLRLTIDRFSADKGRFPESVEELVEAKYLRSVPLDPVTETSSSWILIRSEDPDARGIIDIKSGAAGSASDGRDYRSF